MNAKAWNQHTADFSLTGGGTVYLFRPLTQKAKEWLAVHCPPDGGQVVIEPVRIRRSPFMWQTCR